MKYENPSSVPPPVEPSKAPLSVSVKRTADDQQHDFCDRQPEENRQTFKQDHGSPCLIYDVSFDNDDRARGPDYSTGPSIAVTLFHSRRVTGHCLTSSRLTAFESAR